MIYGAFSSWALLSRWYLATVMYLHCFRTLVSLSHLILFVYLSHLIHFGYHSRHALFVYLSCLILFVYPSHLTHFCYRSKHALFVYLSHLIQFVYLSHLIHFGYRARYALFSYLSYLILFVYLFHLINFGYSSFSPRPYIRLSFLLILFVYPSYIIVCFYHPVYLSIFLASLFVLTFSPHPICLSFSPHLISFFLVSFHTSLHLYHSRVVLQFWCPLWLISYFCLCTFLHLWNTTFLNTILFVWIRVYVFFRKVCFIFHSWMLVVM